ncbi:hypothetical protein TREES_T100001660 [Tupaia chinensis]|uniref:Uncharacterized protein n=1 Tax=Tupaia chinensis TaxID=246437 RepID=L9KIZ6_TUPCH|nr:hypothetical protein TREES_T100001660 [Tupaia chinensis]
MHPIAALLTTTCAVDQCRVDRERVDREHSARRTSILTGRESLRTDAAPKHHRDGAAVLWTEKRRIRPQDCSPVGLCPALGMGESAMAQPSAAPGPARWDSELRMGYDLALATLGCLTHPFYIANGFFMQNGGAETPSKEGAAMTTLPGCREPSVSEPSTARGHYARALSTAPGLSVRSTA